MRILTGLCLLLLACTASARTALEYLPPDSNLDPGIPTPESVLGWDVGDWHVSHDKLVQYMHALAAASPRISVKVIGYTHEQRPLLQLAITSEANQQKLESLRLTHLGAAHLDTAQLDDGGPLVVWLGYSIHGDEPSGSNSSMLVAYYLAASRSAWVEELLAGSEGTIYSVEIEGDAGSVQERVRSQAWVRDIETITEDNVSTWKVAVTDEDAAKDQLLRLVLSDGQISVTHFGKKTYELEEIFINIVEGGDHG